MPLAPSPRSILVVESHTDVRVVLHAALEGEGYPVTAVRDAGQALGALERLGRPGLILLDERLADTEGEHLLTRLRREPPLRSVPVILLTTSPGATRFAVQAVMRKPFGLEPLLAAVKLHFQHGPSRLGERHTSELDEPAAVRVPETKGVGV